MPGEACWKLISWMPGRPQLRESRARYDSMFEKKNGRATSGDRGGEPTVQVARPAWGQTLFVSGEEIVSVTGIKANIVP